MAVLIFGVGGGVSFYEGVTHVLQPESLQDPFWNHVVLGAAAVFEGASSGIALWQFRKESKGRTFWTALHDSKDPTTYTVLAEDAAALTGLAVVGLGVWAGHRWQMPMIDGVASIVIGLLLAGVAVLLVRKSRGLLIGEGIWASTPADVSRIAGAGEGMVAASQPLSMYIGRHDVLLTLNGQYAQSCNADAVAQSIGSIEQQIAQRFPVIKRIDIEAQLALPGDHTPRL